MAENRDVEVVHNKESSRYELHVEGELAGVAEYRIDAQHDGRVVFTHTEIDPPRRSRGLGDRLVRAALDDVRDAGGRARTTCWFVRQFVGEHQEYADLFS